MLISPVCHSADSSSSRDKRPNGPYVSPNYSRVKVTRWGQNGDTGAMSAASMGSINMCDGLLTFSELNFDEAFQKLVAELVTLRKVPIDTDGLSGAGGSATATGCHVHLDDFSNRKVGERKTQLTFGTGVRRGRDGVDGDESDGYDEGIATMRCSVDSESDMSISSDASSGFAGEMEEIKAKSRKTKGERETSEFLIDVDQHYRFTSIAFKRVVANQILVEARETLTVISQLALRRFRERKGKGGCAALLPLPDSAHWLAPSHSMEINRSRRSHAHSHNSGSVTPHHPPRQDNQGHQRQSMQKGLIDVPVSVCASSGNQVHEDVNTFLGG
eukprot:GHVN01008790.1.p1 GENE.GHVN01008790.1~~GHVN01008790.1.p1  ORF type:complete len:330 (+),score=56.52 GHVN01008790.1:50-1039(+)